MPKIQKRFQLTPEIIEGFVGSCLLSGFDGQFKTPEAHKEWWAYCCSPDPFIALAAPRGHAKSTAITISYTLANVLFRARKYVIIVSDTETQACLFLGSIKDKLFNNKDIVDLFGIYKNPETGLVEFEKDTESDIIVKFNDGERFRITAKGAEQKMRGLLWDDKRPDLLVLDDLENDEIVMNKDRREKFRKWFNATLMPIRASDGIIRYVGTILHSDAMLERLMPPEHDIATVEDGLKIYSTRKNRMWKSYKYMAHNPDFSLILWPDKHNKESLVSLRDYYSEIGTPDVYSQEYLNKPIDESRAYFKKVDLLGFKEEDIKDKKLNYYIAGDFAISEKERSDYTAIVVGGVDENNTLYIRDVIKERMDGLTIVETLLTLHRIYDPIMIAVEETQITKALGPFLRESMLRTNTFPNIVPMKPHRTDKEMRARSIQARVRAGGVKFDKSKDWFFGFEDEILRFPRGKNDDQVDAFAYLGLSLDRFVVAPTREEIKEEEYEEELEKYGYKDQGRSAVTGY